MTCFVLHSNYEQVMKKASQCDVPVQTNLICNRLYNKHLILMYKTLPSHTKIHSQLLA